MPTPHDASSSERGNVLGIASLIVAVLSTFAWLPLNLGAAGLASALAVAAILHGERKYAIITPLVIAAVLLFLSPLTLTLILGTARQGNPGLLLLAAAIVGSPFGALAYDHGQRTNSGAADVGAKPIPIPPQFKNFASRFSADPVAPAEAKAALILRAAGGEYSADVHEFRRGRTITLGRMSTSDVVLQHDSVSRQHARIAYVEGLGLAICDLGSVNGTYVGSERIGTRYVALAGVKSIRLGMCDIEIALA